MFKISTYFIKGQISGVTKIDLINIYKRELEIQNVSYVSTSDDTINFTNDTFKFVLNKFANKFSSFSKGQIEIVDEEDVFGIYFQADLTRLFSSAGLKACFVALFFFFSFGFDFVPLIIGSVVFVILSIIGYVSTNVSFPVYFVSLRNNIERELQNQRQ